jgi:hypothetical protein
MKDQISGPSSSYATPDKCEPACKPDPVVDDHLSGTGVTARPQATYPGHSGRAVLSLLGLAPDGGLPSRPGRPSRWWALTPPFHPYLCALAFAWSPSAVCFLLHCPSGRPAWVLPSVMPCGVRTFLDHEWPRSSYRLAHVNGSQELRINPDVSWRSRAPPLPIRTPVPVHQTGQRLPVARRFRR